MKKKEELPVVDGYEPMKKTISMMKANLLAIVFFIVFGVLCWWVFGTIWGGREWRFSFWLVLLLVMGIVVHELVHGITWLLLLRKGFSHLCFGFLPGGVYCHIDVPMVKHDYVIGALMPLFLVGVVPLVASFFTGSYMWLLFGIIMVVSAIGDIMIVWAIRKESADALIYDHPSEAGCYVYHKTLQP